MLSNVNITPVNLLAGTAGNSADASAEPAGAAVSSARQVGSQIRNFTFAQAGQAEADRIDGIESPEELEQRRRMERVALERVAAQVVESQLAQNRDVEIRVAQRNQRLQQEEDMRTQAEGLNAIASSVTSQVSGMFATTDFFARRNDMSGALQSIAEAPSTISAGMASLSSSSAEELDSSLVSGLMSRYRSLQSAVGDAMQRVFSVARDDEQLLQLTGVDSNGRTMMDRQAEMLAGLSISTTPRSTFMAAQDILESVNAPANLMRIAQQLNNKPMMEA